MKNSVYVTEINTLYCSISFSSRGRKDVEKRNDILIVCSLSRTRQGSFNYTDLATSEEHGSKKLSSQNFIRLPLTLRFIYSTYLNVTAELIRASGKGKANEHNH